MRDDYLIFIPLLMMGMGCSDDDENDFKTVNVIACNSQTEWVKDITDFKTKLYKDYPDNRDGFSSYLVCNEENKVLVIKEGVIRVTCDICNLPISAIGQEIPDDGLDIILSAKVHQYSKDPEIGPPIYVYYDMELTSLKIAKK